MAFSSSSCALLSLYPDMEKEACYHACVEAGLGGLRSPNLLSCNSLVSGYVKQFAAACPQCYFHHSHLQLLKLA